MSTENVIRTTYFVKQVWYFISKNQLGLRHSDPLKSSHSRCCLLVCDSVGTIAAVASDVSALRQPPAVACMLPLLLGIHLEVITVLDYS